MSSMTYFRIDDAHGHLAGFCNLLKPAAGMSQLAAAAHTADLAHLERMRAVEHADRRPAAILMADLEASSPLARRLSTAQYFAFVRRLVRAADRCIVDAGGIVGRHAGDGIVAFFLAETHRLRVRRREIVHHRGASPARRAHRDRSAQRDPRIRAVTCGSGSTGVRRCTSGASSPPVAAKSPPSATK